MVHKVQDGFPYYIELVERSDPRELFLSRKHVDLLETIDEEKAVYRYAPGKWSIKQILGHITDHERIMIYRILRFSRKDPALLPGYDQDPYVAAARYDELTYELLFRDHKNVRAASNSFIETLSDEQLHLKGRAGGIEGTNEDFLRSVMGHELHHIRVLREKYLNVGQ